MSAPRSAYPGRVHTLRGVNIYPTGPASVARRNGFRWEVLGLPAPGPWAAVAETLADARDIVRDRVPGRRG